MERRGGEERRLPQEVSDLRATLAGLRKLMERRSRMDEALRQTIEDTLLLAGQEEGRSRLTEAAAILDGAQLMEDIESLDEQRRMLEEEVQGEMVQLQAHLEEARGVLGNIGALQKELTTGLKDIEERIAHLEDRLSKLSKSLAEPEPKRVPLTKVMEGTLEVTVSSVQKAPPVPQISVVSAEVPRQPIQPAPEERPARDLPTETRTTRLIVKGFQDISALRPFDRALRGLSGVKNVEPRKYSAGTLEMLVEHQGDLSMAAGQLSEFDLRMVSSQEGQIELEMVSARPLRRA